MSKYTAVPGDTFELIARKKYGDPAQSWRISSANPGISEPIQSGSVVVIPAIQSGPENLPQPQPADNPDDVSILIGGHLFRFWSSVQIMLPFDSMPQVTFSAPFEHDEPGFRDLIRPFSFSQVRVLVGGSELFTGVLVGVSPSVSGSEKTVSVSCYSLPGVLNDCTMPASAYPLEFRGQTITEIASTLCAPFGLSVVADTDIGAVFEQVALPSGRNVLSFLSDLASQRGLVLSATSSGALLIRKSTASQATTHLQQGQPPLLSVSAAFNPQGYYSDITGIEPTKIGKAGPQYTVKNSRLDGVLRPHVYDVPDTDDADLPTAVGAKMGRMFGSMATYTARVAGWRDAGGELFSAGQTIDVTAPDAMIYSRYSLIARSVVLEQSAQGKTSSLKLVMPGSFSGELPETLPWD